MSHRVIVPSPPLDEAGIASLAARWAARLEAGASLTIELDGPLGAGKTTFARHLLRALGVDGRIKSPTYALVEPYAIGPLHVAHLDLYRLDDPQEFDAAGLRELFDGPGVRIVEWATRAGARRPPADLRLTLQPLDDCVDAPRAVTIEALSAAGAHVADLAVPMPGTAR